MKVMEPTIHCPGCGTEAPVTQKYCRSCGLSLEKVPQLVAEQLSESPTSKEVEKLQRRQQEIDRWLSTIGIAFVLLIAIVALIGLIYLMSVGSLPIVPGIVLLILVGGGFGAGALAMYSERLKKSLSANSSLSSKSLAEKEDASHPDIEAFDGSFLSVTERTTNLLDKGKGADTRKNLVRKK